MNSQTAANLDTQTQFTQQYSRVFLALKSNVPLRVRLSWISYVHTATNAQ